METNTSFSTLPDRISSSLAAEMGWSAPRATVVPATHAKIKTNEQRIVPDPQRSPYAQHILRVNAFCFGDYVKTASVRVASPRRPPLPPEGWKSAKEWATRYVGEQGGQRERNAIQALSQLSYGPTRREETGES